MSTTSRKTKVLVVTLTPPLPVVSGAAYVMNTVAPLAGQIEYHLFAIANDSDRRKVGRHAKLYKKYFATVHIEPRPPIPVEQSFPRKVMHALVHLWYGLLLPM